MGQKLKCKECDQEVDYDPLNESGAIGGAAFEIDKRTRGVYLTCPQGHVHRYDVVLPWRAGAGDQDAAP